jgi:hypothetical protein
MLRKKEVKFPLCSIKQAPRHEDGFGGGGTAPWFFILALEGREWSATHSGRFTPGERAHGTHYIGDWVGPRTSLDALE